MIGMEAIVGQTQAVDQLQSSLTGNRMHHAWIFQGPAGVGKFTTAMALARILLCRQPQRDLVGRLAACEGCDACALTRTGSHPDLHVVTKELALYSDDRQVRERKLMNIPVDVLRDTLLKPVYTAAQAGGAKVFIVDEAELIRPDGQNAMLKTLEEPPKDTYIILVTAYEDRLLPTVLSRCQRVVFVPLADDLVMSWLKKAAPESDDPTRQWVASFAGGSYGQAQLAITYGLYEWAQVVLPALEGMTKGKYPADLGTAMAKRINAFAERWVEERDNASKEAANKLGAGLMWRVVGQAARARLAKIAATCDPSDPAASELLLMPWLLVLDNLEGAQRELASNVNQGLVTDHLVSMMYRSLTGRGETACVTG